MSRHLLGMWRCVVGCTHDHYGVLWHSSRLRRPLLRQPVRAPGPRSHGVNLLRTRARIRLVCPRCFGRVRRSVALWDDFHTGYTETKTAMMDPAPSGWRYHRARWPFQLEDIRNTLQP